MRGCKFTTWEGGIRVPLIIRWPDHFPVNATYTKPVSLVDIYATVAAAAGIEVPKSRTLDSVNLLPFVTGRDPRTPHEVLYACNNIRGKQWSVRRGNWKLVSDYAYKDPKDKSQRHSFSDSTTCRPRFRERESDRQASVRRCRTSPAMG